MRKITLSCMSLLLVCNLCIAQTKIYEKKHKFGLEINKKKITKAIYESMTALNNNRFLIEQENLFGVIDNQGKILVQPNYEGIKEFSDNLYLAETGNKWGLVDQNNNVILSLKYTEFNKINEMQYQVKNGNLQGIINRYGAIIVPILYTDIKTKGDMYAVERSGYKGLVSSTGKEIIPPEYTSITKSADNRYYIVKKNEKSGMIALDGRVMAKVQFDEIDASSKYFTLLRKGSKIGFIVKEKYIPAIYDKIIFFQEYYGIIGLKADGKFGFISVKTGKICAPIYDHLTRFGGSGIAYVEKNGRLMNVDIYGKESSL